MIQNTIQNNELSDQNGDNDNKIVLFKLYSHKLI